jgi:hypothetical protein
MTGWPVGLDGSTDDRDGKCSPLAPDIYAPQIYALTWGSAMSETNRQQPAVESRIEQLEDAGYERLGFLNDWDVVAAFRGEHTDAVLVEENGSVETYLFDEDAGICSCGEHTEYIPERRTPIQTARTKRQQAACLHANVLAEAEKAHCGDCGSYEFIEAEQIKKNGVVINTILKCAECCPQ